jgi:voltage-gated potassium channel Kch
VCRSGSPIDRDDLEIVNPAEARSIIVLAAESDDPDSLVIKTILALTNDPKRPDHPYHIVAEIRNPQNLDVALMVARDETEFIQVDLLISRIAVQTCRQSGLSVVYTELLDFGGDEIYFKEEPELVGQTFGEALLAYEDSALMGLRFRDGRVALNPPMETRIEPGASVIAISQDDDTIRLSGLHDLSIDEGAMRSCEAVEPRPERTLILGWNHRAPTMIRELDQYVAPGSEVLVVAETPEAEEAVIAGGMALRNMRASFKPGRVTDRRVLDDLDVAAYNHIITLSYSDTLGPQEADAYTLITLLHLRDIGERLGKQLPIVSEMLDVRNRELAEVTRADDFIVSDMLSSLMLSQISENKELMAVFTDLFDPEGSELYLKPASTYVQPGRPVKFYTVVESARRCGHVAVGYRLLDHAGDASRAYGVRVNPPKSELVTFSERDRIIVLAEE